MLTSKLACEANGANEKKKKKEKKGPGGHPFTLTDRQSERKDGDWLTQPQPLSLRFSKFNHRNKQQPGFDSLTTQPASPWRT